LDNPDNSEGDWEADNESERELNHGDRDSETEEQWDVSPAPNVPGLIQLTRMSKNKAEMVLITVGTKTTWRSKGIKKKYGRMSQYIFTRFFM